MAYFDIIVGTVLLLAGGDLLVRGAVDLALRLKVSLLVIGMTVVSFATSAPELIVSLNAAFKGFPDVAFGNVIGSNIANIALILGLTAMIFPMAVREKTYKSDIWVMIGSFILLFLFVFRDSKLEFYESCILVLLLIAYNVFQIRSSRRVSKDIIVEEEAKLLKKIWLMPLFLILGVVGLKYGSQYLILGAVSVAKEWNVSDRIIGLTIVSVGTSLPELAASLIASFKGQQELSLGSLIGSNIFNVLAVLGLTGLVIDLPIQSEALLSFDFPWLMGISIFLYLIVRFITKGQVKRWAGLIMFLGYIVYIYSVFQ